MMWRPFMANTTQQQYALNQRKTWYWCCCYEIKCCMWGNCCLLQALGRFCKSILWVIIIPCDGLLTVWRQAVTWANVEILWFGHSGTNFGQIRSPIQILLPRKLCENVRKRPKAKMSILVRPLVNVSNRIMSTNQTHRHVWRPNNILPATRDHDCLAVKLILIIVFFDSLCWNFRYVHSLQMTGIALATTARLFGSYNWVEYSRMRSRIIMKWQSRSHICPPLGCPVVISLMWITTSRWVREMGLLCSVYTEAKMVLCSQNICQWMHQNVLIWQLHV